MSTNRKRLPEYNFSKSSIRLIKIFHYKCSNTLKNVKYNCTVRYIFGQLNQKWALNSILCEAREWDTFKFFLRNSSRETLPIHKASYCVSCHFKKQLWDNDPIRCHLYVTHIANLSMSGCQALMPYVCDYPHLV